MQPKRNFIVTAASVALAAGVAVAATTYTPTLPNTFDPWTDAAFDVMASDLTEIPSSSDPTAPEDIGVSAPTLTTIAELGNSSLSPGEGLLSIGGVWTITNDSSGDLDFSDVVMVLDVEGQSPAGGYGAQLVPLRIDPQGDFDVIRLSAGADPLDGDHDLALGFVTEDVDLSSNTDVVADEPIRGYDLSPLGTLASGDSVTINVMFTYDVTVDDFLNGTTDLAVFWFTGGFYRVDSAADRIEEVLTQVRALTPTSGNEKAHKNNAAKFLDDAVTDIDAGNGDDAITSLRKAAQKLSNFGGRQALIDELATIARRIARDAIVSAQSSGIVAASDIDSAWDLLADGDAASQINKKFNAYKDAYDEVT